MKQVLKYLLVFSLLFSSCINNLTAVYAVESSNEETEEVLNGSIDGPEETLAEDYRAWSQADTRWGKISLGKSSTNMEKSGCTVTSVTKLMIQAGVKNANSFTPKVLVEALNENGGLSDSGNLQWDNITKYCGSFKFKTLHMLKGGPKYSSEDFEKLILSWIHEGYHMTISVVSETQHWVAVDEAKSIATGEVYIMDSSSSSKVKNADIKLKDRYPYFYNIACFTGGTTPSGSKANDKVAINVSTHDNKYYETDARLYAYIGKAYAAKLSKYYFKIWVKGEGESSAISKTMTPSDNWANKFHVPEFYWDMNRELGITLKKGTTYCYKYGVEVAGDKTYWSDTATFTTKGIVTQTLASIDLTPNKNTYTATNAIIYADVNKTKTSEIDSYYFKYWVKDQEDSKTTVSMTPSRNWSGYTLVPSFFWNLNEELGITLSPSTNYCYQYGVEIAGDKTYWSDIGSFTTKSNEETVTTWSSDYRNWSQGSFKSYPTHGAALNGYGCVVVAHSKLLVGAGIETTEKFNPEVYFEWEAERGYIDATDDGKGVYLNQQSDNLIYAPVKYAKEQGKTLEFVGRTKTNIKEKIMENAKNGYYSILYVTTNSGASHYLFIDNELTIKNNIVSFYNSYVDGTTAHKTNIDYKLENHWKSLNEVYTYKTTTDYIKVSYSSNGGSGSMTSDSVRFGDNFVTKENEFTKDGYEFIGWNAYRPSDATYYVATKGWLSELEIQNNGYTKKLYEENDELILDSSWTTSPATQNEIQFKAVWSQVAIDEIEISSNPVKTSYERGEELDTTGLVVTVYYSNGTSEDITSGFTISGFDSSKAGDKVVVVSYGGKKTSFDVTVEVPTAVKIEIETLPNKTTYDLGEWFDTEGLTIKVTYSDGSTKIVSNGFDVYDFDSEYSGTCTVTVEFEEVSTTFDVMIKEPYITEIEVYEDPYKDTYDNGEPLNIEGLSIMVIYNYGPCEIVDSGFEVSGYDALTPGWCTVTVTYEGYQTSFDVYVNEPDLIGITLSKLPNKLVYENGEELDTEGLEVTAIYSNGTKEVIYGGISIYEHDIYQAGVHEIEVEYQGCTKTFEITVLERKLSDVKFFNFPQKDYYEIGEDFDPYGLELELIYNNGETEVISDGYEITGFDSSKSGSCVLTISYCGFELEYEVQIVQGEIERVYISKYPNKTSYTVGEELDLDGLEVTVEYTNGKKETVSTIGVSGFDSTVEGKQTITIDYLGYTNEFEIFVSANAENEAKIIVSSGSAKVGEQVSVQVSLENNPGVTNVMISVEYDTSVLKLVEVVDEGKLGSAIHSDVLESPYTLTWANDLVLEDYDYNGTIVTLIFEVYEDAYEGDSRIVVNYNYDEYDVMNSLGEKVLFNTVDGIVKVTDTIIGDVNGDGKVNTQDRMILTRVLAKMSGYSYDMIDMEASDVNQDGRVNTQDRMILTRYLAKWDGYSTLPYKKERS